MKKISEKELQKFLRKHKLWLEGDIRGERANLCRANLRGANLCRADLRWANLRGANLCEADLCEANLCEADLYRADLRWANLCEADLCEANLCEADLRRADLCEADLCEANLCEADLRRADLRRANLCRADLRWANLRGANLCEANLCEADLCEADLYIACPEKGSFIAFKKSGPDEGGNKYIIELEIPSEARRCSATSRKCRCDKALVLSITTLSGEKTDLMSIRSGYDSSFIYEVGKLVEEPNFNENRWDECSEGIHFFITRQEAVDY